MSTIKDQAAEASLLQARIGTDVNGADAPQWIGLPVIVLPRAVRLC